MELLAMFLLLPLKAQVFAQPLLYKILLQPIGASFPLCGRVGQAKICQINTHLVSELVIFIFMYIQ